MSTETNIWWKFLAALPLWVILATAVVIYVKRVGGKGSLTKVTKDFCEVLLMGVISGLFAMQLPAILFQWFHIFVSPFLFLGTACFVIYFINRRLLSK